jgi:hypothetical protein
MAGALVVSQPAAAQDNQGCPGPLNFFGGFKATVPIPPCPDTSLPPLGVGETVAKPPPVGAPPAGDPQRPEHHVASTDLGFERGIGPAPGHAVTWRGRKYIVVDVMASEGRPTFAGGSRFIITTDGGSLEIGLKALGADASEPIMADATAIN